MPSTFSSGTLTTRSHSGRPLSLVSGMSADDPLGWNRTRAPGTTSGSSTLGPIARTTPVHGQLSLLSSITIEPLYISTGGSRRIKTRSPTGLTPVSLVFIVYTTELTAKLLHDSA